MLIKGKLTVFTLILQVFKLRLIGFKVDPFIYFSGYPANLHVMYLVNKSNVDARLLNQFIKPKEKQDQ